MQVFVFLLSVKNHTKVFTIFCRFHHLIPKHCLRNIKVCGRHPLRPAVFSTSFRLRLVFLRPGHYCLWSLYRLGAHILRSLVLQWLCSRCGVAVLRKGASPLVLPRSVWHLLEFTKRLGKHLRWSVTFYSRFHYAQLWMAHNSTCIWGCFNHHVSAGISHCRR